MVIQENPVQNHHELLLFNTEVTHRMKTSKKLIIALMALSMFAAIPAFAGSTYYIKGDQNFTINAGVNFPGFLSFYNDSERGTFTFKDTHINLGGYASIAFQGFATERLALGGELGYAFNYSRGNNLLTTVPIAMKLTYLPVQTGVFDLGLNVKLGGAFVRYQEGRYFSPLLSLSFTPTVFINDNWGIGVESGVMLTCEFYSKNSAKYKASAVCGMMPVTLALSYRH